MATARKFPKPQPSSPINFGRCFLTVLALNTHNPKQTGSMASSFLSGSIEFPGSLIAVSLPYKSMNHRKLKHGDFNPVVRRLDLVQKQEEPKKSSIRGVVQTLAVSRGRQDGELLALAHSTSCISLVDLPSPSSAPASKRNSLEVVKIYDTTSAIKPANKHLSLDFLPTSNNLLHSTTQGYLSLFDTSDLSAAVQTRRLPANLKALRPTASGQHFAYAGKEVDVSLWDTERAFTEKPVVDGVDSKKRKATEETNKKKAKANKEALLPGEVWRAKNIQNDNLGLRPAISHLCLTYLNDTSSSASSSLPLIATGTSSGHIRSYDPRAQRKPTSDWKVIPPSGGTGGVGTIVSSWAEGRENEIWFGETGAGGGRVGLCDRRTGRVVYFISGSTSTATSLLPLSSTPSPNTLLSLAQDGTISINLTNPLPANPKATPEKGFTVARVGGSTGGPVLLPEGTERGWGVSESVLADEGRIIKPLSAHQKRALEDAKEEDEQDEDGDEGDVWEGMGEIVDDELEADSESDSGFDSEDEEDDEQGVEVTVVDEAEKKKPNKKARVKI
ncbi:WD40/YVTN repeat-like-containing domain [Phaffia rhodozyma]|uniref:Ribosome biogenesis protein NSA1 n=1 Tax=Phaffia rhodozyma TaxID=264483 RepID=A0A0F7SIT3_PHARH|nr:WD40/YVTN repeat-like-containing domain [Phaffia rhodozyma]